MNILPRGLSLIFLVMTAASATAQHPAVHLEVISGPDASVTAGHEWLRVLGELPFQHVRIRSSGDLVSPTIEQRGDGSFLVTGVIVAGSRLQLPGITVSLRETARLREWLKSFAGQPAVPQRQQAFGLSAEQLVNLHNRLGRVLPTSTKGRAARGVIRDIRKAIGLPIQVSATANKGLQQPYELIDELEGVSAGTALAAVLRPLGLVMVPRLRGSSLELIIQDSREAAEFWPIGWPPQQKPGELTPVFFDFLPIEINEVSAGEALAAVQQRLKLPFLFDQNGMARQEIELDAITVSIPASRTFYKKALDRILYQARLKAEVRVDENGKPFVWITPSGR